MEQQTEAARELRVLPAPRPVGPIRREYRSATHAAVMREISRRIAYSHGVMLARGEVLPESLPMDRQLTSEEVEELSWRVYTLACITRCSLVRCIPTLLVVAAEWSTADPGSWEAYCESSLD